LDEIRLNFEIPQPQVYITDFDKALKKVISEVYPMVHQQICIFHINKNMVLNIKKKWKGPSEGTEEPRDEDDEAGADALGLTEEGNHEVRFLNAPERSDIAPGPLSATIPYSRAGIYVL